MHSTTARSRLMRWLSNSIKRLNWMVRCVTRRPTPPSQQTDLMSIRAVCARYVSENNVGTYIRSILRHWGVHELAKSATVAGRALGNGDKGYDDYPCRHQQDQTHQQEGQRAG